MDWLLLTLLAPIGMYAVVFVTIILPAMAAANRASLAHLEDQFALMRKVAA